MGDLVILAWGVIIGLWLPSLWAMREKPDPAAQTRDAFALQIVEHARRAARLSKFTPGLSISRNWTIGDIGVFQITLEHVELAKPAMTPAQREGDR